MYTQAKDELESAGLEESVWGQRIIQAENRNGFTFINRMNAHCWQTCACGQQDPRLHGENGAPFDRLHIKLGKAFSEAVEADDFLEAALTLINIERRSIELLAQL